jgi:hypothetical protein
VDENPTLWRNSAAFTYELIVHILREKVEHEDEFESLIG